MDDMKLIYREAHRASWTGLEFDERVGIASLAYAEALRNHDADRGRLSTLAVTYIQNAFRSELAKLKTRYKYDGIQASTLLPSQIPACTKTPDPEQTCIFRDQLNKLEGDAGTLATLALHTPKRVANKTVGGDGNILRNLQQHLGWNNNRFYKAAGAVRAILQ